MKTTKRALFSSVIALILCFSMLVGTTFAWFTDSVESGVNKIIAGNLDIELYHEDNQVTNTYDKLFEDILWEPGVVAYENITVANEGTLALKYQLGINFDEETATKNGNGKTLADILKVAFVEGGVSGYDNDAAGRAKLISECTFEDMASFMQPGKLEAKSDDDKVIDTHTYGIVIYWEPSDRDNDFNMNNGKGEALFINLGINLYATQVEGEFEKDSFDNTYDEDAWHKEFQVASADDLQAALNNGETNIVLMDDITLTESIVVPAPAATTYSLRTAATVIDLNGKTINITAAYDDNAPMASSAVVNNGTLTLVGEGTIKATNNYTVRNYGTMIIDGITVENGIMNFADLTVESGNISNSRSGKHTIYGNGAKLTVNGGTFYNGNPGNATIFAYAGEVVINDGEFSIVDGSTVDWWTNNWTSCLLDAQGNAKFTITGGVINGEIRDYNKNTNVSGGTFSHSSVKNFVATGFKAVAVDGTYYVVADNVAGIVTKPETLKNALTAAGAAGAGNTTIAFFGSIDMTGIAWTPIKVDGYHGADIVTIEGNGATITGLTAPLFAGGFAGGSGIVIKDLTIADSNIVSTNTIGSGAFIESVDSMALITLDNCHLVNSTVTGGNGSRTGGLIGWTAGYNNVNDGPVKTYVNITNCSVIDCTITCDGSVGGIYGHAGNNAWTYSTIENCTVKNNKLNSTDDGGWRVGVVVGTANVGEVTISNITESGNTLTQTGKTAPAGQSNLYGRFVPGTTGKLVIDGAYVLPAATQEALDNAISAGETEIALPAGNYTMPEPDLRGKTLTIKGTKDTIIDVSAVDARDQFVTGAELVFDGVTLNFGNANYMGFANTASLTYRNCDINGLQFLFGANVSFENCKLNSNGAEHCVWTYGAQNVSFTDCEFTYGDRGINCYSDNDVTGGKQTVNFANCTFETSNTASEGAVEINSCFFSVGIEVNMEGCTAPAHGEMAYVSRWDSTNGAKTTINIK